LDEIKVLSKEEVLEVGREFDCNIIDYGSKPGYEYGICEKLNSGREVLFTGIVYEFYPNGNMAYYMTLKEGAKHGDYAGFYKNGKLRRFSQMSYGTLTGKSFSWHENGILRSEKVGKFGCVISSKEWDENGALIKEKTESSESDKKIMENNERRAKERAQANL